MATGLVDADSINFVILDLARLFRAEFERRVAASSLGLTPSEARVLIHVARSGGSRQHLLAERLGLAPASLTGFLDSLESAGLVRRSGDGGDRRAKRVALTEAADPVLAEVAAIGREVRTVARGTMSEADWRRFRALALATRDNMTAAREQGRAEGVGA